MFRFLPSPPLEMAPSSSSPSSPSGAAGRKPWEAPALIPIPLEGHTQNGLFSTPLEGTPPTGTYNGYPSPDPFGDPSFMPPSM